jgi:valyl-tRNA synthetase
MEFGTGAVKVTPAHDPNDYDCGNRYNSNPNNETKLEFITIFNEDGSTTSQCGEFSNMMRFDVRIALVKKLEELGLYRGRKTHDLCIKKCSRSGDIVEPILKPQWWANMTDLAKRTMDLFHEKQLTITPTSPHHQIWFSYMENIRPWCISRQLWWGHRIPAYLVWKKGEPKPQDTTAMDNWVIATSDAQAIEKAKAKLRCDEVEFEQDSDVLDTWFSSGLFPFSVMGWPNTDAEDFKKYYPTNFLETGYDILFFWVARMVMMGLELTGKLPFTDVFLHTLVRDAKGIKMTKSLGNVIDPICVIEGITLQGLHDSISGGNLAPEQLSKAYQLQKEYFPEGIKECGTDALRFTLLTYMGNKSINLDTKRIEGYRHFCNKIWNAMNLSLMFFGPNYSPQETCKLTGFESPSDIWILSRLNATIVTLEESFKELDFGKFSNALYMFWLYDFCDVYLEVCKPILFFKGEVTESITQQQKGTRATLYTVLDSALKALHPIMPFITEELWQYLPRRPLDLTTSICVSDYPSASEIPFEENAIAEFDFIQLIIKAARNLCLAQNQIKRGVAKATINTQNEKAKASAEKYKQVIITLAYLRPDLDIVFQEKSFPEGAILTQVDETCDLYLQFNLETKK